MTRAGLTAKASCSCFRDVDCKSLMDSSLSSEELKGLLDVVEGGSYKARYGMATFPKKKPKIFAINSCDEMAKWCMANGLTPLQAVFEKNAEALKAMDNNQQATTRRAIVFEVTVDLISEEQKKLLDDADDQAVEDGIANEAVARTALRRQTRQHHVWISNSSHPRHL